MFPITIGSSTLAYDNNGNLISYLGSTYTWDYRNRLVSVATTTTTKYTYDFSDARMQRVVGTATTTSPDKFWDVTGVGTTTATSTSYIWAGDTPLATFDQKGTSTPASLSSTLTT